MTGPSTSSAAIRTREELRLSGGGASGGGLGRRRSSDSSHPPLRLEQRGDRAASHVRGELLRLRTCLALRQVDRSSLHAEDVEEPPRKPATLPS